MKGIYEDVAIWQWKKQKQKQQQKPENNTKWGWRLVPPLPGSQVGGWVWPRGPVDGLVAVSLGTGGMGLLPAQTRAQQMLLSVQTGKGF